MILHRKDACALNFQNFSQDELKRLKDILADKEEHKKMLDQDAEFHTRYWLPEEHQRFLTGLKMYGHKDIKSIARFVGSRSSTQVPPPPTRAKYLFFTLSYITRTQTARARSGCRADGVSCICLYIYNNISRIYNMYNYV